MCSGNAQGLTHRPHRMRLTLHGHGESATSAREMVIYMDFLLLLRGHLRFLFGRSVADKRGFCGSRCFGEELVESSFKAGLPLKGKINMLATKSETLATWLTKNRISLARDTREGEN